MADFEDLYSREMITENEFDWCRRKLVRTELDFNMERIALCAGPVPGQPAPSLSWRWRVLDLYLPCHTCAVSTGVSSASVVSGPSGETGA
ncbi:hypothetical protein BJY52DRAFT_1200676 [Lactarius psammicola]|nr:hypothetical protein BJY52DRAFT_1200676 [Lactarius psammicola]